MSSRERPQGSCLDSLETLWGEGNKSRTAMPTVLGKMTRYAPIIPSLRHFRVVHLP
ncbi:MAG: hypothetical protein ACU88J_11765 [Gammaproteobacteria bacterium]